MLTAHDPDVPAVEQYPAALAVWSAVSAAIGDGATAGAAGDGAAAVEPGDAAPRRSPVCSTGSRPVGSGPVG